MLIVLEVVTAILVGVAMALSLAHALELPGKMRLPREEYLAVQPIYYPGFTIGGAAEPLGLIGIGALLIMIPGGDARFWLHAGALAALGTSHLLFWTMTQPSNRYWLEYRQLTGAAKLFFGTGRTGAPGSDWQQQRNRWERSHLLRAIASMLAFILVLVAIAL